MTSHRLLPTCLVLGAVAACGPLIGAEFDGLNPATAPPAATTEETVPETIEDGGWSEPTKKDAGVSTTIEDDSCLTPEAPTYPIKPARPRRANACSAEDRARVEANAVGTDDLTAGISASCKACVISQTTDPTWGPIVEGTRRRPNPGPCARVLGEGTACIEALTEVFVCNEVMCSTCLAAGEVCPGTLETRCQDHVAPLTEACAPATLETCISLVAMILLPCE